MTKALMLRRLTTISTTATANVNMQKGCFRKSTVEYYKDKALKFAGVFSVDNVVWRIALALMEKDKEEEIKKVIIEKDEEFKKKLISMEKDKELMEHKSSQAFMEMDKDIERAMLTNYMEKRLKLMETDKDNALALMEINKDHELAMLKIDMKKKLKVMEMDKDKELAILKYDMDCEIKLQRAYFLGILADLSQLVLMERFFEQVVGYYHDKNEMVVEAINELEPPDFRNSFINNCHEEHPTYSIINTALTKSDKLRNVIWKLVGLNESIAWPNLPYPILHSSACRLDLKLKMVYILSDMDPTTRELYNNLCAIYKLDMREVDAELLALAIQKGCIEK